ncbi:CoB--CoM heterodisulfide reductase iron-sulfur subunit B family protein [Candidatus Bathyarchaeota archaeon]|nr:CoB--CoM heterodisulfide reductase iron-sulfur subunit B family protein [Candidatus Bathyarchaeota archaeon]
MRLAYYPGCTLKTTAKSFDISTLESSKTLGIDLIEPERWNCCGTVHALSKDDVMHHLAPIRNLLRIEEMKKTGIVEESKVITVCAMCYNTLKRANLVFNSDSDKVKKINENMENESSVYNGSVQVEHLLETIKHQGWDNLRNKVKIPLKDLKVAPYYGCLLLRPRGLGIDNADKPSIMEDMIRALGAEPIDFAYKQKCCGSYHTVFMKERVADLSYKILNQAKIAGAEIIVTACPLCEFNLSHRQTEIIKNRSEFKEFPVIYFTQLIALALGLKEDSMVFGENKTDPRPLFKYKGFLKEI